MIRADRRLEVSVALGTWKGHFAKWRTTKGFSDFQGHAGNRDARANEFLIASGRHQRCSRRCLAREGIDLYSNTQDHNQTERTATFQSRCCREALLNRREELERRYTKESVLRVTVSGRRWILEILSSLRK
jgi:hypothetical protein